MQVLLVDDDAASAKSIEMILKSEGYVLRDPITTGTNDQKDTDRAAV